MNILLDRSYFELFESHREFIKEKVKNIASIEGINSKVYYDIWILKEKRDYGMLKNLDEPILKVFIIKDKQCKIFSEGILNICEEVLKTNFYAFWSIVEQYFYLIRKHIILTTHIELLKNVEGLFLTQEMDKVISEILNSICKVLNSRGDRMLLLRDYKKSSYEIYFPVEKKRQVLEKPKYTFHPDFLDEILFSDKNYDFIQDPNNPERKFVALPIKGTERGIALALIEASEKLEEDKILLASNFALELSSVLENLLLFIETKELTIKDDLTQAYNRRYFEAFVDEELERAKRYGTTFSIIFLDLDDLKSVNNRFGHLMGSRTLQEVAKRIISSVRNVDRVMRFGGDEFCIVLPYTNTEEALIVANRVKDAIAEKPFYLSPNIEVRITASMGIATFPVHGRTKETLIAKADQAMFEVKQKKKNAVAVARNV